MLKKFFASINPKVKAAFASGAVTTLAVWAADHFFKIPPTISSAAVTLISTAAGYQTSSS